MIPFPIIKNTKPQRAIFIHNKEMRYRIQYIFLSWILVFISLYQQSDILLTLLLKPIAQCTETPFIFTHLAEAFKASLDACSVLQLVFTFPVIILQILQFLQPALHRSESLYLLSILSIGSFLFGLGVFIAYFVLVPVAVIFFQGFELDSASSQAILQLRVRPALSFTLYFCTGIGLIFWLPLFSIWGRSVARPRRGIALLISLILASFITPQEVNSLLFVGGILFIFYEICIICRWLALGNDIQKFQKTLLFKQQEK